VQRLLHHLAMELRETKAVPQHWQTRLYVRVIVGSALGAPTLLPTREA
jgi:hypothetical protein